VSLGEDAEQRGVAGQYADLAFEGPGVDRFGLARPHLVVDRDDLDLLGSH
jgi:hypothetical protein